VKFCIRIVAIPAIQAAGNAYLFLSLNLKALDSAQIFTKAQTSQSTGVQTQFVKGKWKRLHRTHNNARQELN